MRAVYNHEDWWEIFVFSGQNRIFDYGMRFDIGTPNRVIIACLREILVTK